MRRWESGGDLRNLPSSGRVPRGLGPSSSKLEGMSEEGLQGGIQNLLA